MFSDAHGAVVFPFPLFSTSMHMVVQLCLSSIILFAVPSLRPRNTPPSLSTTSPTDTVAPVDKPQPVITKYFYVTRLVPCSVATSLDIGLGNMSLKFITLTFLTMCKSSALAFVLLFAFVFGLESPSIKLIVIIATMTIGVVMMVAGEAAFNAIGFALIIASAFFSGFRWGLTQILLLRHPATSNPFSTLFFLTPVMLSSLIVISFAVEGPFEILKGFIALTNVHGIVLGTMMLVFPGILAFCMIASEFALLKRSSVVTLSICGIFKEVVTISAAGVVFHDKLTVVNLTGLIVTIASIGTYNYMKVSRMRQESLQQLVANGQPLSSSRDGFINVADSADASPIEARPSESPRTPVRPTGQLFSRRSTARVKTTGTGTTSAMQSLQVPISGTASGMAEQDASRLSPLRQGIINDNPSGIDYSPKNELSPNGRDS